MFLFDFIRPQTLKLDHITWIYFIMTGSVIEMNHNVLIGPEDPDRVVAFSEVLGNWTKVLAMYVPDLELIKEQLKSLCGSFMFR